MLATDPPNRARSREPGRLSKVLLRLLMRHATVVAVDRPADRFRLITLEGPALRGVDWLPGQKIQIAMGSAFVARTYTPIDWDAVAGCTRILGYDHGEGPGSAWVRGVAPGDECDLFGPRRSLDVSAVAGPFAVLGDETAIGLAHALRCQSFSVACRFEVGDVVAGRGVTAYLGLDDAMLFGRAENETHLNDAHPNDTHLGEMEAKLPALAASGATFVLAGKASTIQRLRRSLKRLAVPEARIVAKVYWAPGRTGLD